MAAVLVAKLCWRCNVIRVSVGPRSRPANEPNQRRHASWPVGMEAMHIDRHVSFAFLHIAFFANHFGYYVPDPLSIVLAYLGGVVDKPNVYITQRVSGRELHVGMG
jgi:hypothetical protein